MDDGRIKFTKVAISIEEQIRFYKERGLTIDDDEFVNKTLSKISYFRLSGYANFFRNAEGVFKEKITFENIYNLYCFDRQLKLIIFAGIEKIENAIRTRISNTMSLSHGTHWFMDYKMFDRVFNHGDFIKRLRESCYDNSEPGLQSYHSKYSEPELPPSWLVFEVISFGQLSQIVEGLASPKERGSFCMSFGVSHSNLVSWLRSLNWLRNVCAHHGRLWNRTVPFEPQFPKLEKSMFLSNHDFPKNKLYASLCCLQRLLSVIEHNSTFKQPFINHLNENLQVSRKEMGFPEDWITEKIWT